MAAPDCEIRGFFAFCVDLFEEAFVGNTALSWGGSLGFLLVFNTEVRELIQASGLRKRARGGFEIKTYCTSFVDSSVVPSLELDLAAKRPRARIIGNVAVF